MNHNSDHEGPQGVGMAYESASHKTTLKSPKMMINSVGKIKLRP